MRGQLHFSAVFTPAKEGPVLDGVVTGREGGTSNLVDQEGSVLVDL